MKSIFISIVLISLSLSEVVEVRDKGFNKIRWKGSDTLVMFGGNVYVNNSGVFTRIDNTVDSCSAPAILTNPGDGVTCLEPTLWWEVDGSSADSNHSFTIEIESRKSKNRLHQSFTGWVKAGLGFQMTDTNQVTKDIIVSPDNGSAAATWMYSRFSVEGDQFRVCPDVNADTDLDSTWFRTVGFSCR